MLGRKIAIALEFVRIICLFGSPYIIFSFHCGNVSQVFSPIGEVLSNGGVHRSRSSCTQPEGQPQRNKVLSFFSRAELGRGCHFGTLMQARSSNSGTAHAKPKSRLCCITNLRYPTRLPPWLPKSVNGGLEPGSIWGVLAKLSVASGFQVL